MSEEEKEAIKNAEKFVYSILNGIGANDCKILLNYIDKLQKENEDMRKELKVTSQMNSNLIVKLEKELENLKEVDRQICNEELITKDKYQDILKENAELCEEKEFYRRLYNEVLGIGDN